MAYSENGPSRPTTAEMVFHCAGARPGPSLGVVGRREDLEKVADRLEAIPTLPYIQGSIALFVEGDAMPVCDALLELSDVPSGPEARTAPSNAFYWAVLGKAAALGIIAGRGVPAKASRRFSLAPKWGRVI